MAEVEKPLNVSSEIQPGVPVWEATVSIIFTAPIIFFTIAGNILVIIAIFTHKPLRNVQNVFIVSLAVTDLLVGLLMFPVGVLEILGLRWKLLGTTFCRVLITCVAICCSASILNLCAIALDRYWAVSDPIAYAQKRTFKRVVTIISLVWFISISICLLPFLGWNDGTKDTADKNSCRFSDVKSYVFCASLLIFYIPLFLLSFVYFRIYRIIKERLKARAKSAIAMSQLPVRSRLSLQELYSGSRSCDPSPERQKRSKTVEREMGQIKQDHTKSPYLQVPGMADVCNLTPQTSVQDLSQNMNESRKHDQLVTNFFAEKQRISLTRERKTIKTLTVIVGAFFVCMAPFFLWYNIISFCQSCIKPNAKTVNFIWWLAFINSTINPIIYTVFNKDFRDAVKKMLKCCSTTTSV